MITPDEPSELREFKTSRQSSFARARYTSVKNLDGVKCPSIAIGYPPFHKIYIMVNEMDFQRGVFCEIRMIPPEPDDVVL